MVRAFLSLHHLLDFLVDPSLNSIIPDDVFVITHAGSAGSELTSNADLIVPDNQEAPYKYASPVNFNGNDPVGLFKNGVLIDIIGEEGNSSKHIENATYRRKSTISEPKTSSGIILFKEGSTKKSVLSSGRSSTQEPPLFCFRML